MVITFRNSKMEKIFNSEKNLIQKFGPRNARVIMRRMMVLAAAPTLNDVSNRPPERCHELLGDRSGMFAVDIKHPYRIIFKPNHDPIPVKYDGSINRERVTDITIMEVGDYH